MLVSAVERLSNSECSFRTWWKKLSTIVTVALGRGESWLYVVGGQRVKPWLFALDAMNPARRILLVHVVELWRCSGTVIP